MTDDADDWVKIPGGNWVNRRRAVRFDPNTTDTAARARQLRLIGWWGPFPSTPCSSCEGELFVVAGDWGMGYRCITCGVTWCEPQSS